MNLQNNFNKIKYYFRRYGFWRTLKKVFKRLFRIKENRKFNHVCVSEWVCLFYYVALTRKDLLCKLGT